MPGPRQRSATNRFRQLGRVSNRGIETSLAGTLFPGLTVVAGTLLLDPKVNGEAVEAGVIGTRYRFRLGSTKLLLHAQITNLLNDYGWKVSSSGGLTFTLPRTGLINLAADF